MATQSDMEPAPRPGRPWLMPALLGGLVVLAAIVALVLTTAPTPAPAQAPAAAAPSAEAPAEAGVAHGGLNPDGPKVEQISLADARAHLDAGTAIFIDVRSGEEYAAGHIPGALTITSKELETRLAAPPEGTVIIAYGGSERPESGQRGAQIFMELGYPTVIALADSFQAWRDAGHPVEP